MIKYKVGEKVYAPNGDIGVIKAVHESKGSMLAEGYSVKFDDCTLFLVQDCLRLVNNEPVQLTLDDFIEGEKNEN